MMDKDKALELMRANRAKANNGVVLRTINLMRHQYERLADVKYALPEIAGGDYKDSINYLHQAGYIRLRLCNTKDVVKEFADIDDYTALEAKLTADGIRLLGGVSNDGMVDV